MKLIIFDVDGVLEKEEKLQKARYDAQIKAISKKISKSIKETEKDFYKAKKELEKKGITASIKFSEHFGLTRKEHFKILDSVDPKGLIEPYEGCYETIKELSKRHMLVTYSNASRKSTINTLKEIKVFSYFKKIFTSEDFLHSKPSSKNLIIIMKKMNFSSNNTKLIGNSIDKDIQPAKKAGVKTVLFDPFKKYQKEKIPDFVTNKLSDILSIEF